MAGIELYDYQIEAIEKMHNGCILCGGVGSGKSLTALGYFYKLNGGNLNAKKYNKMKRNPPMDLYIITTARKRDTLEWDRELLPFLLSQDPDCNSYQNSVKIDSWNNVQKYSQVEGAFFIFDEQRVVGKGTWVKSFLKIAKNNKWILLSATPGDTWMDYVPVFLANGFYRNRTDFNQQHVIFSPYTKYPSVLKYVNIRRLMRLRDRVLVDMDFNRSTRSEHENITCTYDRQLYMTAQKRRWDVFKEEPIQNAGGLCYVLRKVVNSDSSRLDALDDILKIRKKIILFYNFDYEEKISLLGMVGSRPSGDTERRQMGIPCSIHGGLRGVELHQDGYDGVLFAELLLQSDGAGLRKDRTSEHPFRDPSLLPSRIAIAHRSSYSERHQDQEELQRTEIREMVRKLMGFFLYLILSALFSGLLVALQICIAMEMRGFIHA